MFCDGCAGAGAGDCTCAFATGTAAARTAAVKNCVQSRIVFSPILRASSIAPARSRERQHPRQALSRKSVPAGANELTCREGMLEPGDQCRRMELVIERRPRAASCLIACVYVLSENCGMMN